MTENKKFPLKNSNQGDFYWLKETNYLFVDFSFSMYLVVLLWGYPILYFAQVQFDSWKSKNKDVYIS